MSDDRVADNGEEPIDLDVWFPLPNAVAVTQEMVDDSSVMKWYIAEMMERSAKRLEWYSRGSRDPWPHKGFDFRLNKDRNHYPEPEECECCGRPYDD